MWICKSMWRSNIKLKVSNEGGRENPIYSGYRPTFRTGFDKSSDCVLTLLSEHSIKPGTSGIVEIKILHPNKITELEIDHDFSLTEGLKEVASGSVISIQKYPFKEIKTLMEINLLGSKIEKMFASANTRVAKRVGGRSRPTLGTGKPSRCSQNSNGPKIAFQRNRDPY